MVRVAVSGKSEGVLRIFAIGLVALVGAGCGTREHAAHQAASAPHPRARTPTPKLCVAGAEQRLGSIRLAYVGLAAHGAVAYRRPAGAVVARFAAYNVNHYPTMFGVLGRVVGSDCAPRWYHVELPLEPNGITGYVRARALTLRTVRTRIVVDVSSRRLTLYRNGNALLTATVAVGAPATPTPTGRYYVNQRLVPADPGGPYGPGAVGISAFSNVLTGWAQGGPVAIHGTNEPWSIGKAVSNGCIRLPNTILRRVFRAAWAGTPVVIVA